MKMPTRHRQADTTTRTQIKRSGTNRHLKTTPTLSPLDSFCPHPHPHHHQTNEQTRKTRVFHQAIHLRKPTKSHTTPHKQHQHHHKTRKKKMTSTASVINMTSSKTHRYSLRNIFRPSTSSSTRTSFDDTKSFISRHEQDKAETKPAVETPFDRIYGAYPNVALTRI